jgi:hypothetical protein
VLLLKYHFTLRKYVCNALKSSRNLTDRRPKTTENLREKIEILLMTLPEGWQLCDICVYLFLLLDNQ